MARSRRRSVRKGRAIHTTSPVSSPTPSPTMPTRPAIVSSQPTGHGRSCPGWPIGSCRERRAPPHGVEIKAAMGVAERPQPADNDAFTNTAAATVLRRAADIARALGEDPPSAWAETAARMVLSSDESVIQDHDGYRADEDKSATPSARSRGTAAVRPPGSPRSRLRHPPVLPEPRQRIRRQPDAVGTARRIRRQRGRSPTLGEPVRRGIREVLLGSIRQRSRIPR